ncbi:hypothetical protein MRB53_041955 [Persea americana]|nr:hypothetical protein MRB53_041955 [Persea americana]
MFSWFIEVLRHILTALAIAGMLALLLRQSRRMPARELGSGYLVLQQPPLYRWLGWFSAGLGAVMLVASAFAFDWQKLPHDGHEQLGFGAAVLAGLMFLGLSWPLLRATATVLTLTPLGIASDGPQGQHTFLPWADLTDVRYNPATYELKLATPTASLKAGRYLVGFERLVAELGRRGLTPAQMGLPLE